MNAHGLNGHIRRGFSGVADQEGLAKLRQGLPRNVELFRRICSGKIKSAAPPNPPISRRRVYSMTGRRFAEFFLSRGDDGNWRRARLCRHAIQKELAIVAVALSKEPRVLRRRKVRSFLQSEQAAPSEERFCKFDLEKLLRRGLAMRNMRRSCHRKRPTLDREGNRASRERESCLRLAA